MASKTLFRYLNSFAYNPSQNIRHLLNTSSSDEIKKVLSQLTQEDIETIEDEGLIYQLIMLIKKHYKANRDSIRANWLKEQLVKLAGDQKKWLKWDNWLVLILALGQVALMLWSILFIIMLGSGDADFAFDRGVHLLTIIIFLFSYNGLVTLNLLRKRIGSTTYAFYFKEASGRSLMAWGALASFLITFLSLLLFLLTGFGGLVPFFLGLVILAVVRFSMAKTVNHSFLSAGSVPYFSIFLIVALGLVVIIRTVQGLMLGEFPIVLALLLVALCLWNGVIKPANLSNFTWVNYRYEKENRLDIVRLLIFFLKQWLIYASLISLASFTNPYLPYLMFHINLLGILWVLLTTIIIKKLIKNRRPKLKERIDQWDDYKAIVSYLNEVLIGMKHERILSKNSTPVDKFYLLNRFYNAVYKGGLMEIFSDKVLLVKMAELEALLEETQSIYAANILRWAKTIYKGDWYAVESMDDKQLSQFINEFQASCHSESTYSKIYSYSAQLNEMLPMLLWKSYKIYLDYKEAFVEVY